MKSTVFEITTPINEDGSYSIDDQTPFGPDTYTWMYTGGFFSQAQGGAFRLPNGNTLITEATQAYIFEIDQSEDVVWSYQYPTGQSMIPRAQKYSYDYFDNVSIPGDLNDDLIVNILDVVLCVNIILGMSENNENADLNDDGIINVLDLVSLVNIILN